MHLSRTRYNKIPNPNEVVEKLGREDLIRVRGMVRR
jgi:hypothetical protein